jgi:hypothetical protein
MFTKRERTEHCRYTKPVVAKVKRECSNFKLDTYSSMQPETKQGSSVPFPIIDNAYRFDAV